ncbi:MAG: molecular chaperone TorD family protein [Nitrospirae bacterium]|nr:molecular chaperone TorD family protein [Nitrospirota bacterium]
MIFETNNIRRAESYRILAQLFLNPPDVEALESVRQDFSLDLKESIEQITEDFDLLFSLSQGIVQPVESLFSENSNIDYINVNEFYISAGLVIDDSYEMVSDHLSVELLFMSYLIDNSKTVLEKNFLEQHLMNWVPYYCDQIIKVAKTAFYREIAEIVKDYLTAEHEEYQNEDYGPAF